MQPRTGVLCIGYTVEAAGRVIWDLAVRGPMYFIPAVLKHHASVKTYYCICGFARISHTLPTINSRAWYICSLIASLKWLLLQAVSPIHPSGWVSKIRSTSKWGV